MTRRPEHRYRAEITSEALARALAEAAAGIGYTNFKDSVADLDRDDAYMRIWGVMASLQDA